MVKNCFTVLFFLCNIAGASEKNSTQQFKIVHTTTLFEQSFELFNTKQWGRENLTLIQDDINYISPGNGQAHLRVSYVPTEQGSARVLKKIALKQSVNRAQLSYKVKFDEDFEFVRGGKLHGLGGGKSTTGCKKQSKDGWSVRIMWTKDGEPLLYVYDQNRTRNCGNNFNIAKDFRFKRNVWHLVTLEVKLNSAPNKKDGWAQLTIDGELLLRQENLQLSGAKDVLIDTFLFSTFHGGNTPNWSPSKKVYAAFDDFEVIAISELN